VGGDAAQARAARDGGAIVTGAAAGEATPYYASPSGDVTLYRGDALAVLRALPAGSVHTCITSPPYWNLRDYSAEGQIGMEATPAEYVATIVAVFDQVCRVLRDDGTLWLNLGDSYASDTKWGGSTAGKHAKGLHGCDFIGRNRTQTGLVGKNLVGIPWRVAFALQDAGWILRSDIVWSKPNPMPESVRDRPTRSHEYIFLLSKGPRYFFDQEAVREPGREWAGQAGTFARSNGKAAALEVPGQSHASHRAERDDRVAAGRNIRSVWEIATEPYPEAHFATFPTKLVEPCLLSGTSARGCCPACGAPWVRVVERGERTALVERGRHDYHLAKDGQPEYVKASNYARTGVMPGQGYEYTTTGWRAGCACDAGDPTPAVVLDPFAGAATTGVVARKHGRHFIGVDLSESYLAMARERLGQLALPGLVAD
jgi:DNA modification methylase